MSITQAHSELKLLIHPLSLINIVDHYTRIKVQSEGQSNIQIIGVLLGSQSGPQVTVATSYELKFTTSEDNSLQIDQEFFEGKQEQMKQILPDLEHIGWYFIGETPDQFCSNIQRQIESKIDNPLLLLVDIAKMIGNVKEGTNVKNLNNRTNLPLTAWEAMYGDNTGDQPSKWLQAARYEIASDPMESIGIDWSNAKAINSKQAYNQVKQVVDATEVELNSSVNYFTSQLHAIELLKSKLKYLVKYLNAVKQGELEENAYILNQIKNLSDQLPQTDQIGGVDRALLDEYSDTLLVSYLTAVTKGMEQLSTLIGRDQYRQMIESAKGKSDGGPPGMHSGKSHRKSGHRKGH